MTGPRSIRLWQCPPPVAPVPTPRTPVDDRSWWLGYAAGRADGQETDDMPAIGELAGKLDDAALLGDLRRVRVLARVLGLMVRWRA